MGLRLSREFWPSRADGARPAVARDADRVLSQHGDQAYDAAGLCAWREEIGLLYVADPGHWQRVRLEIARRIGQGRTRPGEAPARIGALHLI